MTYFNEPTADSKVVVSDEELYTKALKRYREYSKKNGFAFMQPSPRLTEFNTNDDCKVEVTLHNNETYRNDSKLYSTKIKVTDDAETSYSLYEKGL